MIIKYHFGLDVYFIAQYDYTSKVLTYYVKDIDRINKVIKFVKVESADLYFYITEKRKDLYGLFYGCLKTVITDQTVGKKTKDKFFKIPDYFTQEKKVFKK